MGSEMCIRDSQLDTSSEEESSEMETLKTIETLRHFKEQSSSE